MKIAVDLTEVTSAAVAIGKAGPKARAMARTIMQKTLEDMKRDAKILAPVDTGNLRSSISYDTRVLANVTVGELGPTAEYGIYQELGTSEQPGTPFLAPAFDRHVDLFEQAVASIPEEFF